MVNMTGIANTTKTINQAILDFREDNASLIALLDKRDEARKVLERLEQECKDARDKLNTSRIELEIAVIGPDGGWHYARQ